jgi:hypothetical protein
MTSPARLTRINNIQPAKSNASSNMVKMLSHGEKSAALARKDLNANQLAEKNPDNGNFAIARKIG